MRKESILIISFLILINRSIAFGSNEVLLKSRRFVPERGISSATKAKIESIPGRAHVLVQLEEIPTINERKELESKGIKLLSYIPNKAWFASIPSNKANEIAALTNVRAISEILPEDKIAPQIREKGVNDYSTNEQGKAKLAVLFFADVSLNEARIVIESYAGTFAGAAPIINALVIYLPKGLIKELASDDSVKWINQHYKPFTTNDGVRDAIGVDTIQAPPYNLKGTGVIAGEWDGGWVDTTHDDLEGRVTIGDTGSGTHDHSTHVAGTMLGDGTKSEAEGGGTVAMEGYGSKF
jgi:hypothetical protein